MTRLLASILAAVLLANCSIENAHAANAAMPEIVSEDLNGDEIKLPWGLPAERSIIFIAFAHAQRNDVRTWIDGMHLVNSNLPWVEMPLIDNPGAVVRMFIRTGMGNGTPDKQTRFHIVPVFTDKAKFLQALGIHDEQAIYALVVDRRGDVLKTLRGNYNPDGARTILQTLQIPTAGKH